MISKINFSELIQAITTFINKTVGWVDSNIIHNLGAILKSLGNLIVKMLLFMADAVKWLVSFI